MDALAYRQVRALVVVTAVVLAVGASAAVAKRGPFISRFSQTSTVASTMPASGPAMNEVNPYGVAVVPRSKGDLVRGDVLVSNFNNAQNQQGTGTSIVEVSPGGQQHVFAVVPQPTSTPAVGLTTALVALRNGFVIVGSLPAPMGDSSQATAGALSVLDANGNVVQTITAPDINGPWDMTATDHGNHATLYVTNVLNGTVAAGGMQVDHGTVVRLGLRFHHGRPQVTSNTVIGDGFPEKTDPNALVIGPTGVGLGRHGILYVADSIDNRIAAIPNAAGRSSALGGGGMTVASGGLLNDPLGLTIAPGGDIVTANGNDGNIVETSPAGPQVAHKELISNGGGDLFGLAVAPHGRGLYYVNDGDNTLDLLH